MYFQYFFSNFYVFVYPSYVDSGKLDRKYKQGHPKNDLLDFLTYLTNDDQSLQEDNSVIFGVKKSEKCQNIHSEVLYQSLINTENTNIYRVALKMSCLT